MPRPRQALLSRQRIVDAAAALIDADGLEAFSTRRLAAELGVRGPSLYNHFATKDEILDAVADSVTAQVDVSFFGRLDWREALRRWGHSYRAALAAHPNIACRPAWLTTDYAAQRTCGHTGGGHHRDAARFTSISSSTSSLSPWIAMSSRWLSHRSRSSTRLICSWRAPSKVRIAISGSAL
ncbi:TetR family transcriptional regulator [Micromonospora tulbaghiae]|uniref:TetR/AcrR family transcriptional regulator n=1 Tax=Micromonospora tulbaghiae TaxID=479978 RepID=UPI0033DE9FB9